MIDKTIKKVLVIGSGPIIIGQAAEFDYAGTQACRSLKEEGIEVVLVNSNPATIMTDGDIADKVYIEPLNVPTLTKIIEKEKPDSILPTLGGQTGLNLAMELDEKGVLKANGVRLIGIKASSIKKAEDRQEFKDTMEKIGEPCIESLVVHDVEAAVEFSDKIGYPVIVRPAYTLGGTGGGIADDEEELREICSNGLRLSRVNEVLIEKCIAGWKEIEYEVMRDGKGNCITVCNMENLDPVGVHTGDSIVVAPSQTLMDKEYQMLRSAALNIITELGIEGGCNVQFALHPDSFRYAVIEVNPRVSRSSALASKATGYPIARIAAKIALGLGLDEIPNAITKKTYASFEPALDYCVVKIPKWPFDKFVNAKRTLGTQMKATGEVMAISRSFECALQKALHSLEENKTSLLMSEYTEKSCDELLKLLKNIDNTRLYVVAASIYNGISLGKIHDITKIDMWFLTRIENIVNMEKTLMTGACDRDTLLEAKRLGFTDDVIANDVGVSEASIKNLRRMWHITPSFSIVDTCAAEFKAETPYYYSDYCVENEVDTTPKKKKIIVLGSGPIRIGQGVEFDYCSVHSIWALKKAGCEAIIVNNNPETVSTDYTTSDKLYFEPLTVEDVMNIIELEKPLGVVASLGGQTAINLAEPLAERGVKIIGTDCIAIDNAENRDSFERIMEKLDIPQPKGKAVTKIEDGVRAAEEIGYPVLVRPSYVLGGRAMQIVADEEGLRHYLKTAVEIDEDKPVLVDKYIVGKELEVDAVCDGKDVFVPGIMEHVERTGIHSGDSISVYPTFSVSEKAKKTILDYTKKLGLGIGICGLFNIQFIVDKEENVYVIEVNPRSSRTVPFLSKATGYAIADIATLVMLGHSLKEQGYTEIYPQEKKRWYVKTPAFSFSKIRGLDAYLSPEMKSTGEAIGYDDKLTRALYKSLKASGMNVVNYGTVLVTVADKDKEEALPLIRRFYNLGFNIEATAGTARFLKENGIRTRVLKKISEGSDEIERSIRQGHISYVINTSDIGSAGPTNDGYLIRKYATENNVTMFTALDTVKVLLDVLEETTLRISTIDA